MREPWIAFRLRLSASVTFSTTKRGMPSLMCPASSIGACMVDLLSVRGRIVDGGEAGATPALPLGRRRTDADLTERPSGALEGRGGAAPASPPARGRGPLRRYGRAPGALRAPEGPRRAASDSLDVAELLEALANLLLLFLG